MVATVFPGTMHSRVAITKKGPRVRAGTPCVNTVMCALATVAAGRAAQHVAGSAAGATTTPHRPARERKVGFFPAHRPFSLRAATCWCCQARGWHRHEVEPRNEVRVCSCCLVKLGHGQWLQGREPVPFENT